jgi:hypothetical protein
LYIAIDDLLLAIENGHEIQSKHENVQWRWVKPVL